MEGSPHAFYEFPDVYVHNISASSDTGIKLNLLQNIIFIPVDIFLNKLHNEGIKTKLDAWLTFLGCDDPEYIMDLISKYPEFEPMYSHLYDMCRNIEGVMNMFSKELQIMDHNTATYMIDELQEELDTTKEQLDIANSMNLKKDDTISSQAEEITRLKKLLADKGIEA